MIFCALGNPRNALVLALVVIVLPLLLGGYPANTFDGLIHLRRDHHFATALWSGDVYPRWSSESNHGFGSPSFFFYPPISSLASALFWPLAPQIAKDYYALGWASALGIMLSGMSMWVFLKRHMANLWAAAAGSILYTLAPYHFGIDLFCRGANAEVWSFVFLPLILNGLDRIHVEADASTPTLGKGNFLSQVRAILPQPSTSITAMSIAGLLCSHIFTGVTFAPVILAYALSLGRKVVGKSIMAAIFAVCLSAIYLVPLFAYKGFISGARLPFFQGENFSKTYFFPNFSLTQPMLRNDDHGRWLFVAYLGLIAVCAVGMILLTQKGIHRERWRQISLWSALLYGYLIAMTPVVDPIFSALTPLKQIQFAWRLLAPATFIGTMLLLLMATTRAHENPLRARILRSLCIAVYAFPLFWVNAETVHKGYRNIEADRVKSPIKLWETDALGEFYPYHGDLNVAQKLFKPATNVSPLSSVVIAGKGSVSIRQDNPRTFVAESASPTGMKVLLHQFWFPGWKAMDVGQNAMVSVSQDPESGLIALEVPRGKHVIRISLSRLWPEVLGICLSFLALLLLLLSLLTGRQGRLQSAAATA